jgi:hypothetical protein
MNVTPHNPSGRFGDRAAIVVAPRTKAWKSTVWRRQLRSIWAVILRTIPRSAVCILCIFVPAVAQDVTPALNSVRQQLIVVTGVPGTDEYKATFESWATRWRVAAEQGGSDCTLIGSDAGSTTDLENLKTAIDASISVETAEPLWVVFIGHGTFDGRTASLNLTGPDISSEMMAELLQPAKRPLAFIACSSCSGPFLSALSGPNRIVITATKDGNQIQYSRFGEALSLAISGLDADINRDGQTSLLEAWLFASRRTAEYYTNEGRLATEHALLDDNGDEKGTRVDAYEADRPRANIENADQLDGANAARWHFIPSDEERRLTPEQRKTRDELEAKLEALRKRREELSETEYLLQLEELLVPLARLYEAVDESAVPTETLKQ